MARYASKPRWLTPGGILFLQVRIQSVILWVFFRMATVNIFFVSEQTDAVVTGGIFFSAGLEWVSLVTVWQFSSRNFSQGGVTSYDGVTTCLGNDMGSLVGSILKICHCQQLGKLGARLKWATTFSGHSVVLKTIWNHMWSIEQFAITGDLEANISYMKPFQIILHLGKYSTH